MLNFDRFRPAGFNSVFLDHFEQVLCEVVYDVLMLTLQCAVQLNYRVNESFFVPQFQVTVDFSLIIGDFTDVQNNQTLSDHTEVGQMECEFEQPHFPQHFVHTQVAFE